MVMVSGTVDRATRVQQSWPVVSKWEGKTGHPRRMLDTVVAILRHHGFAPLLNPEPVVRPSGVSNTSDFDGAAIFGRRGTRLQALRARKVALIVWLVLAVSIGGAVAAGVPGDPGVRFGLGGGASLVVAIWALIALSSPRRFCIGVVWRGETYQAEGRTAASTTVRQAANVVSDVRLATRAYSGFRDPLRSKKPQRVDPRKLGSEFQMAVTRVTAEIESALPKLLPEWT